ncbi:HTH-type transcriptional activator RhaS [Sporomusa silvacetica DSM 10669]|uniref:HTH-type transcriptional activator RhaS n=1 Tax=Sporomusa silvacetica DSM 10669 TaxID=1123289 RepID=A0ABZ3IQ29_9FIRM|nr:AraC family transcriptional regulator [Sporomusa silvacetica]OZC17211.1 HTH-type transcriptional activator RhaS [Sporomusa silvacetica DSM 10669]
MSKQIGKQQEELAKIIESHTVQDGVFETAVPSLAFVRFSKVVEPVCRVYKPSICFIAQGLKEVLLAQELFQYGPTDYLLSSMNLPVTGQVIQASSDVPYLSLRLEFTQTQIFEVLKEAQIQITSQENTNRAMFIGHMEASLLDAILRLARLQDNPADIPFLAPIYTKELLYRLLQGQYRDALAQMAMGGSITYRIRVAIDQIIDHFDQLLRIEELAETANMGVSTFHRHFKEVTAMSPIQFQKQLRLQEAQRLLLSESADAAEVAFRVGYESSSQFNREYSRMFGLPPKEDIKRLKADYDQSMNK